jgi:hypothetical protein
MRQWARVQQRRRIDHSPAARPGVFKAGWADGKPRNYRAGKGLVRQDSPTRPLQAPGGPPHPSPCPATEQGGHLLPTVGLDDARAISGPLHRSAALLRRCHRVVGLAHGDDLVRAIPIQAPRACRLTPHPCTAGRSGGHHTDQRRRLFGSPCLPGSNLRGKHHDRRRSPSEFMGVPMRAGPACNERRPTPHS